MTEQTEKPQIQTTSTPTPTLNEQQRRLIHRLKEGGINTNRFLKVGDGKLHSTNKHPEGEYLDKAAFETDFQNNLYGSEDLGTFPRWGIIGKEGLTLLDFDKKEIYDILDKRLPDTLEATSPRHGLPHRYYKVIGGQVANNKFHIPDDVDERGLKNASGEIRSNNHYLVAPGTTIRYQDLTTGEWKTGEYTITNDIPIATLTYAEFMAAVEPYLLDRTGEKRLTDEMLTSGVSAGVRHDTIFRYACRLMGDNPEGGYPATTTLDILIRYNRELVQPPVEDEYIHRVIKQACEYAAKESGAPVEQIAQLGFKEIHKQQSGQDQSLPEQLLQIEAEATNGENTEIEEYEKNIKFIEKEIGPINWQYIIDEKHPFRASELASYLMTRTEYSIITDKEPQLIYLYLNRIGVYRKDGEQILRTMIDKALGKESTTHRINETITLLKYKTYAAITQSKKIAVLNGLLDIQTGQVTPFNKLEFITNKLNVEYKEEVKSEQWENFIEQVCPDDEELLQEWSGYLLIKGYPYHAIMWLYGPTGRNGKGTWARTMQAILSEANYSSVSIDEFDGKHRFAVFNLHDSLFNICSEPRTDRSLTIEMLQMLTGQDSVDAERKGVQERFKFKNGAKMTVMGNKFPNVDKPTDAFWDRLKLCKFPSRFVGKDQIADIEKSWLDDPEQRSGVLNWMLEGAKRLITNGFTATKTQQETIIQFKRASDSIGAFITECLEFNPQKTTPKAETYDYYKEYCDSIGVISESNKAFNEKLCNTPKIKNTSIRIGVGKVKTKVWKGITLKPLPEESPDDNELKTGTTGTNGTTYSPYTLDKSTEIINKRGDTDEKAVPPVPTVPSSQNKSRVCGDCGRFHTGGCQHPMLAMGGAPELMKADSGWACSCQGFIPKQPEMPEYQEEAPMEA